MAEDVFILAGFQPYEATWPCFALPLFVAEGGRGRRDGVFIQGVSERTGLISRFFQVEREGAYRYTTRRLRRRLREAPLYVFIESNGRALIGLRQELRPRLQGLLGDPTLTAALRLQIAEFIEDVSAIQAFGRRIVKIVEQEAGGLAADALRTNMATTRLWDALVPAAIDSAAADSFLEMKPRPSITVSAGVVKSNLANLDLKLFPTFSIEAFLNSVERELYEDFYEDRYDDGWASDAEEAPLDGSMLKYFFLSKMDAKDSTDDISSDQWFEWCAARLRKCGVRTMEALSDLVANLRPDDICEVLYGGNIMTRFYLLLIAGVGPAMADVWDEVVADSAVAEGEGKGKAFDSYYLEGFRRCLALGISVGPAWRDYCGAGVATIPR